MNRLVLFIKKIYVLLLFLVLEIAALNHYASSTSYTKAKMLTASNKLVGGIHRQISAVGDYFGLRRENDALLERIAQLQNTNELLRRSLALSADSLMPEGELGQYAFATASVIDNSVVRQENYIMIDKGSREGIRPEMALVTPGGAIVGYVLRMSEKFSYAISILNTEFHTGGKIKGKEFFGSIYWDGKDHSYVTLSEIPKYADIAVGDTIVTGYSSIFPSDLLIGTVVDYELDPSSYYNARVELAADMARIGRLLVVNYADMQERLRLERGDDEY